MQKITISQPFPNIPPSNKIEKNQWIRDIIGKWYE
jgi:hypothetical protein